MFFFATYPSSGMIPPTKCPKWRLRGTSQPNSINLRHTGSEGFTCPAAPGKTKTTFRGFAVSVMATRKGVLKGLSCCILLWGIRRWNETIQVEKHTSFNITACCCSKKERFPLEFQLPKSIFGLTALKNNESGSQSDKICRSYQNSRQIRLENSFGP